MKAIARPKPEDAPGWCPYFWNLVKEDDLLEAFQNNLEFVVNLIDAIPHSKHDYKYAPGKWTVKDVFIHLIDTERFYSYRAFNISRKVDIAVEFNANREKYAANSNAENRSMIDIAEEWEAMRDSSIFLFESMTDEMLDVRLSGKAPYTARAFGWMIVGHTIHHCNILEEKYLQ